MKEVIQWFLQRVTGFILLFMLILHFYNMHFDPTTTEHSSIIERFSNPYWIAFYILFLATLSYHGFNGLRGMAIEYVRSESLLKAVQILILFFSITAFSSGLFIILK